MRCVVLCSVNTELLTSKVTQDAPWAKWLKFSIVIFLKVFQVHPTCVLQAICTPGEIRPNIILFCNPIAGLFHVSSIDAISNDARHAAGLWTLGSQHSTGISAVAHSPTGVQATKLPRTTSSILVTEQKGTLTGPQKHSLPPTSSCLPPQGQVKEVGNNLSKAVVEPGAINLTLQKPPGYNDAVLA